MGRSTWLRRVSVLVTSATMAGFGLTGIASAQTITNTGPNSTNSIDSRVSNNCSVRNTNDISTHNSNSQNGNTGDANASGNTTAGVSWAGWSALDPNTAQANGVSFDSWRNGVTDWMAQRGTGNGWNSSGDNLSWAPSGNDWSGFDPMTWQANGQSFGDWWNGTQSFLNNSSPLWLLNWPANATGDGNFSSGGASTGSVTNNNSSNFSINVNNAASVAAGTNACGQNNFVAPPSNAGMGAGPSTPSNNNNVVTSSFVPQNNANASGASGAGGFGSGPTSSNNVNAPQGPNNVRTANNVPATSVQNVSSSPSTPSAPVNNAPAVNQQQANISNTGPNSNNEVSTKVSNNTSVTNTNDISVSNSNWQSGDTGNANVSGNTTAGSGDTGNVSNWNSTSVTTNVSN